MSTGRKILKFAGSMRFALILLAVLTAACAFGSFITQGQSYEWYAQAYSEQMAALIKLLGLDDVFHSPWFVAITLFLCGNLLMCNVLRISGIIRHWKSFGQAAVPNRKSGPDEILEAPSQPGQGEEAVRKIFARMGFHKISEADNILAPDAAGLDEPGQESFGSGGRILFAAKNRAGLWGAWICHLGILLLIAGFGLGQMTKKEYTVYGVPGQSMAVGDTDYVVSIEDFRIDLRSDDTVEQYTADITVRNIPTGERREATISVNNPASLFGMKFYQNSTGWAATATVLKNGEEIQQEVICAGDYLSVKDKEGLVVLLSAIYPDYYMDPAAGPSTLSSALNNPGYLYRAYYMNQVIGMNVLTGNDEITIDEYTVRFSDPQAYTLIQIRQDKFTPLALLGGLIVLLGLILSFYVQPQKLTAVHGADGAWQIWGESRKGGALFRERLHEAAAGKEESKA